MSKIANIRVLNDGMTEASAGALFDKIAGFADYGFNKSHSVEYSLISWQCMWLKTYHAVEFYAAALTLMDEDKLPKLLRDAKLMGVSVGMPDINISTDRFEIVTDTRLVVPFQRLKGLAGNTTQAIIEARKAGPFTDKADFLSRVEKRKCNARHQETLDKIGAFSRIEPSQPPSTDPSRIRDQIELLPGLITANVPVQRDLDRNKEAKEDIVTLVNEYRKTEGPEDHKLGMPVRTTFGREADFMLVMDSPTHDEDSGSMMGFGSTGGPIEIALTEAGLSKVDVYWTALIKKLKLGKQVAPEEIATWRPYLQREIDILKPPVIVLMGTAVVRAFFPDFKGKASEQAGNVIYSKELDANIVIGFNPGEVFYDPDKQSLVNDVFIAVNDLLG